MKERDGTQERRRQPRLFMDLPIEYRLNDRPLPHGGIVVNGSTKGFLVYSIKDIPIGTRLKITVLFPKGFELTNFEVLTEVVRKDQFSEKDWEGYQYGLKFVQIGEEDFQKLVQLLSLIHFERRGSQDPSNLSAKMD